MISDVFGLVPVFSPSIPSARRKIVPYVRSGHASAHQRKQNLGGECLQQTSALLMHDTFRAYEWVARVAASTIHRRKPVVEDRIPVYKA